MKTREFFTANKRTEINHDRANDATNKNIKSREKIRLLKYLLTEIAKDEEIENDIKTEEEKQLFY